MTVVMVAMEATEAMVEVTLIRMVTAAVVMEMAEALTLMVMEMALAMAAEQMLEGPAEALARRVVLAI